MVIRAVQAGLDIREQPIVLHVRGGESKPPRRSGTSWRHLRLMLVYSPGFLFLVPGAVMVALGLIAIVTRAGEPGRSLAGSSTSMRRLRARCS